MGCSVLAVTFDKDLLPEHYSVRTPGLVKKKTKFIEIDVS